MVYYHFTVNMAGYFKINVMKFLFLLLIFDVCKSEVLYGETANITYEEWLSTMVKYIFELTSFCPILTVLDYICIPQHFIFSPNVFLDYKSRLFFEEKKRVF